MKRYRTSEHRKWLITVLGIALIITVAISANDLIRSAKADNNNPVIEYQMTNQHIEWSGAGYNGIWGK